jgi:hypothetical protein
LICCKGTRVELDGHPIITSPTPIEQCELEVTGRQIYTFSSDPGINVSTVAFRGLQTDMEPILTNTLPDSGTRDS